MPIVVLQNRDQGLAEKVSARENPPVENTDFQWTLLSGMTLTLSSL